jgi:hypothetical protein
MILTEFMLMPEINIVHNNNSNLFPAGPAIDDPAGFLLYLTFTTLKMIEQDLQS